MRVLYATDGSAPAREGESLIHALFDPEKVTIHAFSVAPEPNYGLDAEGRYTMDRPDLPQPDLPLLGSAEVAREAAGHLADAGFTTSSSAARGHPAFEILRALHDDPFDAVVVGAGHSTWLGNLLMGSVSTHVLHHAPCSVLVTHHAPIGDGRVMVGLDGSAEAMEAARFATRLLDPTKTSLSVVTVETQPWLSIAVYPPGPPFGSFTEYREVQQTHMKRAWHTVDAACEELRARGFTAEPSVLSGGAGGSQLLKEAENLTVDLVVVGSRGLGPIKRSFLGSVGDQVVRHARATLVGRSTKGSKESR